MPWRIKATGCTATRNEATSASGAIRAKTEINRIGYWTEIDRLEMDAQFRLAMSAAIEAGAEHCATEPSTHFGTRAPIAGYQRD